MLTAVRLKTPTTVAIISNAWEYIKSMKIGCKLALFISLAESSIGSFDYFLLISRIFFYIFSMCVCLVTQSCPTLCNPMDCSPPGSSVCGILQARIVEWVAMPFSRGSPPRDWTWVSRIVGRFFATVTPLITWVIRRQEGQNWRNCTQIWRYWLAERGRGHSQGRKVASRGTGMTLILIQWNWLQTSDLLNSK